MNVLSHMLTSANGSADADALFYGIVVGIVSNNQDPEGLGRVKVRLPWLSDENESNWARVCSPMAGADRGTYFLPEVEDEVLVAFEHGQPDFPYILGALWNGKDKPPEANDGENNLRTIKSRSGHTIRLDDTDGAEKIEIIDASNSNSIVIDTAVNTLTITAEADLTIQSNSGKLVLSGNGVEISSMAGIAIKANQKMDVDGGALLNLKGQMVNIN